jgi:hypothetical protein
MKKKSNSLQKIVVQFFTILILGTTIVFFIHQFFLEKQELPLYENKIVLAYVVNSLLAITIFLVLYFLRNKYRDQLGFLFLYGSLLKFLVFFIFFFPSYKADGTTSRLEFLAFFVPYVVCLIIEISFLIKLLNLPKTR